MNQTVRTINHDLYQTLNYTLFGAVGDGVVDDTVAVRSAHTAANESGKPVVLEGGRYLLNPSHAIEIETNVDFGTAIFSSAAPDKNTKLFQVVSRLPYEAVTSNTPLAKGETHLDLSDNGFYQLFIASDDETVKRYTNDTTFYTRSDCKIVSRGTLHSPLREDYVGGTNVTLLKRSLDDAPLEIKGGVFNLPRLNYALMVLRSNTTVKDTRINFISPNQYNATAIYFSRVANCTVDHVVATGAPYEEYGYVLGGDNIANLVVKNFIGYGGWGVTGFNRIDGLQVTNSTLNRVDAHYAGYDIDVSNNNLADGYVSVGYSGGSLRVSNNIVSAQRRFYLVVQRGDYGSTHDGDIDIHDNHVTLAADYTPLEYHLLLTRGIGNFSPNPLIKAKTLRVRNNIVHCLAANKTVNAIYWPDNNQNLAGMIAPEYIELSGNQVFGATYDGVSAAGPSTQLLQPPNGSVIVNKDRQNPTVLIGVTGSQPNGWSPVIQ